MSRQIRFRLKEAESTGLASGSSPPDSYPEAVVKAIPGDILGAYITAISGLKLIGENTTVFQWGIFILFLVICPIALKKTKVTSKAQRWLSTLLFAIWAWTYGGPFLMFNYPAPLPGIVLGVITAIAPYVVPAQDQEQDSIQS